MPLKIDQTPGNDPKVRRSFILYEFHTEKPIFECYKNLLKTLGDDFMDYIEFEFWFMRFARGKFDLDYDYSKRSKLCITSLPPEILAKIIGNDPKDRFIIRSVCNRFRALVDFQTPDIKEICVQSHGFDVKLKFDKVKNVYSESSDDDTNKSDISYDSTSTRVDRNFMNVALDDLTSILMHPNHVLESLTMTNSHGESEFNRKQRNQQNRIGVRNLIVHRHESIEFWSILLFFQPGTLQNITIKTSDGSTSLRRRTARYYTTAMAREHLEKMIAVTNRIARTEQYQQAQMLTFTTDMDPKCFPLMDFFGFSKLTVEFTGGKFTITQVFRMVKLLRELKKLQLYYLEAYNTFDVERVMRELSKPPAQIVPSAENTLRYPIPNSNEFVEVEVKEDLVRVERKD